MEKRCTKLVKRESAGFFFFHEEEKLFWKLYKKNKKQNGQYLGETLSKKKIVIRDYSMIPVFTVHWYIWGHSCASACRWASVHPAQNSREQIKLYHWSASLLQLRGRLQEQWPMWICPLKHLRRDWISSQFLPKPEGMAQFTFT